MKVEEFTLTTSPTVVVAGDYIKAGASLTVRLEEGEDLEEAVEIARGNLTLLYKHALLCEIRNITSIQKRDSRKALVSFLKKATGNGKEEEASTRGKAASREGRTRRVRG